MLLDDMFRRIGPNHIAPLRIALIELLDVLFGDQVREQRAELLAKQVEGVKSVSNKIDVKPNS